MLRFNMPRFSPPALLSSVLLVSGCVIPPAAASTQEAQPTVEVVLQDAQVVLPADLSTGHIAVTVKINGSEPMLFQVDTYASIDACIDDDVAKALGLPVVGTTLNSDGVTTRTKELARIDQLECGGATFKNLLTLIDDYDWIRRRDGKQVAGLLGFTAFRDLLLTIDYPGNRLVLERGALGEGESNVIAYTSQNGSPDVMLRVGDKEFLFALDTGSGSGLMMFRDDTKHLDLAGDLQQAGASRTVYGTRNLWSGRLSGDVGIGGHKIENPDLLFQEEGQGLRLLGRGILGRYAVSFDQQNQRIRFALPEGERESGAEEASGGQ